MDEEKLIEERKEKLKNLFLGKQLWVFIVLIVLIILGFYTRVQPLTDHNGHPGLWDITTNGYTLGPDLDPWLFTRYAKTMIETGSLPKMDNFRYVPLGYDTSYELQMVSYMIVATYKLLNIFGSYSVEYAAAFMPVLFFMLTIISFFLFVREIFLKKDSENKNLKANIIAIVSTFFMITIPVFLSRTVAGIPEKESVGFFFMFLSFYLFLKAWKSEKIIFAAVLGILAGISTALMGLTWGGVVYIYTTISIAGFAAFLLNKFHKKEFIVYGLWLFSAPIITMLFTNRFSIVDFFTSVDSALAIIVFLSCIVNFIISNERFSKFKIINSKKIPRNIISLIITIVLIMLLSLILLGPSFLINKFEIVDQMIFHPSSGRWSQTVAENAKPDFNGWISNFGPFIKSLPIFFWLFIIGSIYLFKKTISKIPKKDSWMLTIFYALFIFGMIFSKYSSASILNGENFISKFIFYASGLLFVLAFIYYYMKYFKSEEHGMEKIEFTYIFIISLFILCLFTTRSAVRLIMVLGPIAPIMAVYLGVEITDKFRRTKDETGKVIMGILAVVVIISLFITAFGIPTITSGYYQITKSESYNYVPSIYNQQWQKAMQWVRNETPSNSVFAHWWDYGYWVQSIGNRATVLDGGNAKVFWNYWMGRLVLTGDNQKDSLDYLYAHNASYLLIDSSDIGKYGAFSSIGSNANYDRFSWIGTYLLDEKNIQETKNETIYVYNGGSALDEDLIINENGKQVLLASQRVGVGYIFLPMKKNGNQTTFGQPYVLIGNNVEAHRVNLRYLSVDGKFIDFGNGTEACAFIFPSIIAQGQGVGQNPLGAAMFLSPRLMRGYLAQKYILNDPFNKFPNFKVAHTESNLIVENLRSQGLNLPEFIYYNGVQGPITIWKIDYPNNQVFDAKYLDTDASKYLTWSL